MRDRGLRSRGIERWLASSAIARVAFRAHQDVSIPERPLRDSIPCAHLPLSTLQVSTRVPPRMTRGQIGSLNLVCMRLALTAPMPVSLAHNGMDPSPLYGIECQTGVVCNPVNEWGEVK